MESRIAACIVGGALLHSSLAIAGAEHPIDTYFGYRAGAIDHGSYNVYLGNDAAARSAWAANNMFIGSYAGYRNVDANNTFVGDSAGAYNVNGERNTFVGTAAGFNNNAYIPGYYTGVQPRGSDNTFIGTAAGRDHTAGSLDTAIGRLALASHNKGSCNTAAGEFSLTGLVSGEFNTSLGRYALSGLSYGSDNVAIGAYVAVTYSNAITSADTNIVIGARAAVSNSRAIAIGWNAIAGASDSVRIGNTSVTSIGGQVGWTAFSDERGKKDIAPIPLGLEVVMALKPVQYRLMDGNRRRDLGFIAQDIDALLGDAYNVVQAGADEDHTLALRHADLIAPLVKAMQQQQDVIAAQRRRLARLASELADLEAEIPTHQEKP